MIDLRAKRGLVVRIANEHSIATGTLLHSIAYAPAADLHGRMTDCSAAGFALAMDVSCHTLRRMARLAIRSCRTLVASWRIIPVYGGQHLLA